jgi:hypothetical protein
VCKEEEEEVEFKKKKKKKLKNHCQDKVNVQQQRK